MCVEIVEQGTQDTTLRGSYVQGDARAAILCSNNGICYRMGWLCPAKVLGALLACWYLNLTGHSVFAQIIGKSML